MVGLMVKILTNMKNLTKLIWRIVLELCVFLWGEILKIDILGYK